MGCRWQAEAQNETFILGEQVVYSRGLMYSLVSEPQRTMYLGCRTFCDQTHLSEANSYSRGHMYPQTSEPQRTIYLVRRTFGDQTSRELYTLGDESVTPPQSEFSVALHCHFYEEER